MKLCGVGGGTDLNKSNIAYTSARDNDLSLAQVVFDFSTTSFSRRLIHLNFRLHEGNEE
jgi:hypothetical protein